MSRLSVIGCVSFNFYTVRNPSAGIIEVGLMWCVSMNYSSSYYGLWYKIECEGPMNEGGLSFC
jgi:hypothetical protein